MDGYGILFYATANFNSDYLSIEKIVIVATFD